MIIGFIGAGKMAGAIIKGLQQTDFEIIISARNLEESQRVSQELDVAYADSHQELINRSYLVVLGVKPQVLEMALAGLTFDKPVMSMAAGVTLERLSQLTSQDIPLIRIMPNLNAQILKSTTALCTNDKVSVKFLTIAKTITNSFGTTFDLAEKDFNTFTALAGSSPAYIYLFIEALAKAGVKYGIPKNLSLDIVTQTVLASAENLLEGNDSPHDLIDKISSPGGTTIAGLLDLEKTGFTASVISSIDATIEKANNL